MFSEDTPAYVRQQAIKHTEMEKWNPPIRRRMQELGLSTFLELWQRMVKIKQKHPDFFGDISYNKANDSVRRRDALLLDGRDYKKANYLVAAALGNHPEDLFGPLPNEFAALPEKPDLFDEEVLHRRAQEPLDKCLRAELEDKLYDALGQITNENRQFVLTHHYGLAGKDTANTAELAKAMNLSTSRVRDILTEGVCSLKNDKRLKRYLSPDAGHP